MNDYSYTPKSDRRAFIFLLSVFVLSVILFFAIGNGEEATPDDVDTSFSAPHYAKRYRHYDAKRHAYIYDEGTATPTELLLSTPTLPTAPLCCDWGLLRGRCVAFIVSGQSTECFARQKISLASMVLPWSNIAF